MSIRAHRVKKIIYTGERFNLWYDEKLVEFFEGYGFFETLSEGSGITELPTEALKEAVAKAKELGLTKEVVKQLEEDARWGDKYNSGYVRYYCF